jgi:hypothetical protein
VVVDGRVVEVAGAVVVVEGDVVDVDGDTGAANCTCTAGGIASRSVTS